MGGHSNGCLPHSAALFVFMLNINTTNTDPPFVKSKLVECVLYQSCVGPARGWGAAGEAGKAKFEKGPEMYNTAQFKNDTEKMIRKKRRTHLWFEQYCFGVHDGFKSERCTVYLAV